KPQPTVEWRVRGCRMPNEQRSAGERAAIRAELNVRQSIPRGCVAEPLRRAMTRAVGGLEQ
ncbi:MAG: hypothetical protein ACK557_02830, partial [Planctomycetota bacterium]